MEEKHGDKEVLNAHTMIIIEVSIIQSPKILGTKYKLRLLDKLPNEEKSG